jgi:single-strand DNA-binding protein
MNLVIEIGRLTRDCEVRYANDSAIGRFTLAVDRKFKKDGEPTADFISCVCFGKKAEFMEKYGRKGVKFVVTGEIRTGSYTNKDGNKVYTTDVVANDIEFAESKNNSSDNIGARSNESSQPIQTDSDGFLQIPDGVDEELPFK